MLNKHATGCKVIIDLPKIMVSCVLIPIVVIALIARSCGLTSDSQMIKFLPLYIGIFFAGVKVMT
ncbi:hypothetical protein V1505DRAFT_371636 [Lipomyces doorenjongii]